MRKKILKILMLAAEAAPIAKVGGLADVVGSLPKELARLGLDVRLMLPFYGLIDRKKFSPRLIQKNLPLGDNKNIDLFETRLPASRVAVYLIKHHLFSGKYIYRHNPSPVADKNLADAAKFSLYCRAALAAAKKIRFRPDVIHVHDWHAAAAIDFLKSDYADDPFFKKTRTLYTIHNLANQGRVGPKIIGASSLDPDLPVIKADLADGDINFMAQGILGADFINTVSPTYAKEILTHYQGAGLDKILKKRKKDLFGILNGIDTDFFNPEIDRLIKTRYGHGSLELKKKNKLFLQQTFGLPRDKKTAVVALVTRLVWQKGINLITEKVGRLDCQFVILGSGQKQFETKLTALAKKFPGKIAVKIGFDEGLAHQIYAGADIFLVPSRFEPCGLTQMIAMRYGTVPLVRSTGGLADTVNSKVGFIFKNYKATELYGMMTRAIRIYYQKKGKWQQMQKNGMKKDFSWEKPAKKYLSLYKKMLLLNKK